MSGTSNGAVDQRSANAASTSHPEVRWGALRLAHRSQLEALLAAAGVFRPDEIDVALEVFDELCEDPESGYMSIAAVAGHGELLGFALYGPTPCTVGTWDLYWIAVHPEHQGLSLGRGLMDRVEAEMRASGARMCVIETSSKADYCATRRFYVACGYREVGRVPDFYAEGDDLVVFTRRL